MHVTQLIIPREYNTCLISLQEHFKRRMGKLNLEINKHYKGEKDNFRMTSDEVS